MTGHDDTVPRTLPDLPADDVTLRGFGAGEAMRWGSKVHEYASTLEWPPELPDRFEGMTVEEVRGIEAGECTRREVLVPFTWLEHERGNLDSEFSDAGTAGEPRRDADVVLQEVECAVPGLTTALPDDFDDVGELPAVVVDAVTGRDTPTDGSSTGRST